MKPITASTLLAILSGAAALAQPTAASAPAPVLHDKTLVAWLTLANLTQRGGSALTLSDPASHFDAIVFGELQPGRWMAGSDVWLRTQRDQRSYAAEFAAPDTPVQMAITYRDRLITLYRNGLRYAQYTTVSPPQTFGADSFALFGIRHLENGDDFAGGIQEARIYAQALSQQQLAALRPGMPSALAPWAWWVFADGECQDRTGRFAAARLVGGAKLEAGKLWLEGKRAACLIAAQSATQLESLMSHNIASLSPPLLPGDIEAARRLRNHLLADPYRPTYHFTMPEGDAFPFDPNGAIYWQGRYHLFYIYQERGLHCYGHVSSVDLVHWRQHPPALYPTFDSPDRGMFSGNCFVNKQGEATMLYHGVDAGNCIATSSDPLLERWQRLPSNPIIPNPGPSDPYDSWDPCGWLDGNTYYAIFGGQARPHPATIFRATDIDHWHYVGKFLHHDMPDVAPDEDIGCPDFFKLGSKWVLVCISHGRGARYYIGDWKNDQFYPEVHERMSWVDNLFFAPESLTAPDGRRILWAWLLDQRTRELREGSGWFGDMSLPRELALGENGRLSIRPLAELERLRYNEQTLRNLTVEDGRETVLDNIRGNTLELLLEIEPREAKRVGVKVCRSPGGEEQTVVFYDAQDQALKLDVTQASLQTKLKKIEAAPLALKTGEALMLRVFVDRSIVEAFANSRQATVRRMYPSRPDSLGVSLFSEGGSAKVGLLKAWQMAPANAW
jgi:sucrose-6-phosphate hydrolase SacC (GH32 family)